MLRAFAYAFLIVFQLTIGDVRGNSYGNFADDDSGSQGVKSPQNSGPDTSISSLPQYESAGTSDQNYWWQQNNPFRRPANHPGVEKGDSPSSRPHQQNPYQNQNKLHPTSHSRPNVFTPPQQPPNPFNSQPGSQQPNNPYSNPQSQFNPKPNQQFQQNSPSFGSPSQPNSSPFGAPPHSPQPQNNFPPSVDEGCQLMNKADCHGAKNFPQQQSPPSTAYEPPRPAPFNQPQPNKPTKGSPFGGQNPSVPQPSTNYKPPSYGNSDDEPSNSDFNPKPLDSSNKFSPSQDDIEAPSYGPISNDHTNAQPQNEFPSPSQPQKPQSNNPFSSPSQPQKPQSNNPFSPPSQPQKPQSNNPYSPPSEPQKPQSNSPFSPPSQPPKPQSNNPFSPPQPQNPQSNNPYAPPSPPQNSNPFSPPSQPQNPQGNDPYDPSNLPKNPSPNNYQQEPSQSSPQILSQVPQRPYQGAPSNPYAPPQNTPQRNPADNGQQPYRPNPSPPQNFNNKPAQPQRPNNFIQPTNKPYKPANQPQTAGNNDYSDQLPYPGCPAAMLCVPESRCNVEGVIEERSIQLSQAEKDHRVALMACSHPMTGVIGVCCRDPNYKDPWPDMNGNGMPKKEHHHHPDKGDDFGGNPGNNSPFRQPSQQQNSPSAFQPNPNQRQPHQLQPQQYQPQREQPQRQQYQPQNQQYQPQNQQYQPQSQQYQPQQQQQYQPQDQQRQPSKNFGGYPSDGKNNSNQFAQVTRQEHFPECKLNEMCVERSRCHNGYIRDESTVLDTLTINVRISTGSKKCKADLHGRSFICCRRQPSNTIKPDLQFASTVIKESTLNAPRPIYQNNHHLQNTVAPPVSTLISGVGPLTNQDEINLRFRISNFNPYISPANPFSPINRANVTGKHEKVPVTSSNNEVKNKTPAGNQEHSKNEPSRVENQKKGSILKETQAKPDVSIGGLKKLVGDFKKVSNLSTTTQFSFGIRPTTISSVERTSTNVNSTAEDDEDYVQSTTTTTTPKPYIHNGKPVPLNDHFKNHPPIGCIHKGSEFHIESLVIPSKNYQLPVLDFNVGEEIVPEEVSTKKTETDELSTTESLIPALNSKSNSKLCPDGMVCLAENLCPSMDNDTTRSNIRTLQCQQPKSLRPGVCCSGTGKNENLRNNTFSEDNCGVRRPRSLVPNDKSDTFFGEFPWQIMILNSSDEFICSGALLDKRTIITTAKCIHQLTPGSIKVRVGEWNRQNNLQSEPTEDVPIQSVIVHPDFDSVALKNDIALLFTERNITYDYHVGRVCLPPTNENFDGRSCITTGWAASRKYANKSSYLKQKELLLLSQHNCQGRLQHNPYLTKRFVITRSNICARGDKQDICESDVGDPLVCKSSSGEYQLVGLSSWTGTCGQINVPGIYVNISHLTNWITTHMNRPKNGNNSSHK